MSWEKEFDEKFPLSRKGGIPLNISRNDLILDIKDFLRQALESQMSDLRKEVEGRKSKPSYGSYTTQDAKVFWEGKDAAFDEVLLLMKK